MAGYFGWLGVPPRYGSERMLKGGLRFPSRAQSVSQRSWGCREEASICFCRRTAAGLGRPVANGIPSMHNAHAAALPGARHCRRSGCQRTGAPHQPVATGAWCIHLSCRRRFSLWCRWPGSACGSAWRTTLRWRARWWAPTAAASSSRCERFPVFFLVLIDACLR